MSIISEMLPNKRLSRLLVAILAFGTIIAVVLLLNPIKPAIPGAVKNRVTSTILIPRGGGYSVDRESAKYSSSEKLLTFKVMKNDRFIATITEQPSPDTFTDIPEFSSKFFQQAGEYKTFESATGTVHLLHPQKGVKDAAAMNAKGTLMFINPSVSFNEDDWRKLFQSISIL